MNELAPIGYPQWVRMVDRCIARGHVPLTHGAPGTGKTSGHRTAAERNGLRLRVVNLNQLGQGDVHGARWPDIESRSTVQLPAGFLPRGDDPPTLLTFDELGTCPEMVRKPALELLGERRLDEYALRDCDRMSACTNTGEDGVVHYELDRASADRFCHLHLQARIGDWVDGFALRENVDERVVWFLTVHPDELCASHRMEDFEGRTVVPSPRSWTRVSESIRGEPDPEALRPLIAGWVGTQSAIRFLEAVTNRRHGADVLRLLEHPRAERAAHLPDSRAGCYRLGAALPAVAAESLEQAAECLHVAELLASGRAGADTGAWAVIQVFEAVDRTFGTQGLEVLAADPDLAPARARIGEQEVMDGDPLLARLLAAA